MPPSFLKLALTHWALCLMFSIGVISNTSGHAASKPVQQPDPTPFLMLDNGMHVGQIYRLGIDGAGKRLVTGSTDKSIRLWDVTTGRLLRRLHVPVASGQVGSVLSVALTANGKYLLAASQSFQRGGKFDKGSVYFIHVEKGVIVGRIPELPANVTHIAMSRDSKYFALVMGKWGFSLRSAGGKELFKGRNIENPVEWLAFSPDNRFATVSRNGEVRLYAERKGKIVWANSVRLKQGLVPYSLAFSPTGKHIAVGYSNAAQVDVIDAATLQVVRTLRPKNLTSGNLGAVAWSMENGRPWLYAAGTAKNRSKKNVVVAWPDARSGKSLMLGVSQDSIPHLKAVPTGGVAFASAEPSWGHVTVGRSGRQLSLRVNQRTKAMVFRETARKGLALSDDGARVIVPGTSGRMTFDLRALDVQNNRRAARGFHTARESSSRIQLKDWYGRNTFRLGSTRISLLAGERALSADIDDAKGRVLIGTDFYLRLYDRSGKAIAKRRLTTPAWGVVAAKTKDVTVVAHGDGTLRWYSLRRDLPLAELAGAFLHSDRRRWVAWTADGLFANSAYGGEAMVGYYKNGVLPAGRKKSLASLTGKWIGFEQIYRLFYNPSAVSRVLDQPGTWSGISRRQRIEKILKSGSLPTVTMQSYCTLHEMPNLGPRRGLMALQAPKNDKTAGQAGAAGKDECVKISAAEKGFSAANNRTTAFGSVLPKGAQAVRLQLQVNSPGAIGPVDAFVNGRNVGRVLPQANRNQTTRKTGGRSTFEGVLPVYPGENKIVVRAYNASGIYQPSDPIYLSVPAATEKKDKSVLRVLAIGIDRYQGQINPLAFAVRDAKSFAMTIKKLKPKDYDSVDVVSITDQAATRARIEQEITRIAEKSGSKDAVLIYLAGHGISDKQGNYFFVPADVKTRDAVWSKGLGHQKLVELLTQLRVRNVFLFLDTCYSGAFKLNPYGPGNVAHETGQFVLTASTSYQEALDGFDGKNGIFAAAVQKALGSKPVDADVIDALDLGSSVRRTVPKLAKQKNFSQSAVFKAAGGDIAEFPIAQP
jgi:Caspase domain/WD domain, G-beta repeat